MDYWGVVRQAWDVSRRTRPLWWLGVISAAQLIVYTFIMMMLVAPMIAIPRLLVVLSASSSSGAVAPELESALTAGVQWLTVYGAPLVVGIVAVMVLWLVLGVFDVAAQPGLITQANAAVQGGPTSVRAGMRDGFRLWWRTIGLLALSALPALLYLLAMALVMLFTVTLPLYRGQLPDPVAANASSFMLSPLSILMSIVSIPLGVWVALGLRFATMDDLEMRPALRAAWGLIRSDFVEVALAYLVIAVVAAVVSIPFGIVIAFVTAVGGIALVSIIASGGVGTAFGAVLGIGSALLLVLALLIFAFSSVWFVYQSVVWTLFWRRLTGRDPERASEAAASPVVQGT